MGCRRTSPPRVAVTRPAGVGEEEDRLAAHLKEVGLDPVGYPLLHRRPSAESGAMRRAVERMKGPSRSAPPPQGFDWLLFTSRNAIPPFLQALREAGVSTDSLLASGVRVAAVGQPTADALTQIGLTPSEVPERYTAEDLLDALISHGHAREGSSFLLPQAEVARDVLASGLRARGAEVVEVVAYRVTEEPQRARELVQDVTRGKVEAVTLTSGRAAGVLGRAWGELELGAWPARVPVVGIGPVTAQAAGEAGLPRIVIPAESTFPALAGEVARILRMGSRKTDVESDL